MMHQSGVDPNWEVQFNPPEWRWWRWVGSPSPMTGAIPNFTGGTSAFYLGLAWQLSLSYEFLNNLTNDFTRRMWVSGGWGPAIHNGPLTIDRPAAGQEKVLSKRREIVDLVLEFCQCSR